jgi:hypothetical protein
MDTITTFSVDQLKTIWEYANPAERVFVLLGLNCAFGMGEIGKLMTMELRLKGDGKSFLVGRRKKKSTAYKYSCGLRR